MKTADPEKLAAVSERLKNHSVQLQEICQSLRDDHELLFPSYTGHHQMEGHYDTCIGSLENASKLLTEISGQVSTVIAHFHDLDP